MGTTAQVIYCGCKAVRNKVAENNWIKHPIKTLVIEDLKNEILYGAK